MNQVNAADLATSLTTDDVLIDVREPDEFVQAHVPGAQLVPAEPHRRLARRAAPGEAGLRRVRQRQPQPHRGRPAHRERLRRRQRRGRHPRVDPLGLSDGVPACAEPRPATGIGES